MGSDRRRQKWCSAIQHARFNALTTAFPLHVSKAEVATGRMTRKASGKSV